jgi:hypothetical protein
MERTTRLLFWLMIIGPLHMGEQILTNVEELELFKGAASTFYGWLPWLETDKATVALITLVFTAFTLMFYMAVRGGTARLIALALFGAMGANEIHHVFEAIGEGGYDPGLVTCFAYSFVGFMLLWEVWKEFRGLYRGGAAPLAA